MSQNEKPPNNVINFPGTPSTPPDEPKQSKFTHYRALVMALGVSHCIEKSMVDLAASLSTLKEDELASRTYGARLLLGQLQLEIVQITRALEKDLELE